MALKYLPVIGFTVLAEGALACATCSGPADAPQTLGMNAAILTLFGVMCVVGLTIATFIGLIALRVARQGRADEVMVPDGPGAMRSTQAETRPVPAVMLES